MDRAFLVVACAFGLVGVALGAFGSHALRRRLSAEGLSRFETGVRYQLWHAFALFAVVFVHSLLFGPPGGWVSYTRLFATQPFQLFSAVAGWLFVAGVLLFSGSLYALALTGDRRWAGVTPFGGVALLLGWLSLLLAILIR